MDQTTISAQPGSASPRLSLAGRDGVIGLVLYNKFLEPRWKEDHSL